jgi:hypothetical protein
LIKNKIASKNKKNKAMYACSALTFSSAKKEGKTQKRKTQKTQVRKK